MTAVHPVPAEVAAKTRIRREDYERLYAESVADPEGFWGRIGKRLDWMRALCAGSRTPASTPTISTSAGTPTAQLNASVNCLDRHLDERGDKTAILWESDDPARPAQHISYRQLHARVCQLANALTALGVVKGDRITIYLPMIPEAAVAMLACARIGAVHSVVFGGFSPDSIAGRIADCESKLVITADEGLRGGKHDPAESQRRRSAEAPGHELGRDGAGGAP